MMFAEVLHPEIMMWSVFVQPHTCPACNGTGENCTFPECDNGIIQVEPHWEWCIGWKCKMLSGDVVPEYKEYGNIVSVYEGEPVMERKDLKPPSQAVIDDAIKVLHKDWQDTRLKLSLQTIAGGF